MSAACFNAEQLNSALAPAWDAAGKDEKVGTDRVFLGFDGKAGCTCYSERGGARFDISVPIDTDSQSPFRIPLSGPCIQAIGFAADGDLVDIRHSTTTKKVEVDGEDAKVAKKEGRQVKKVLVDAEFDVINIKAGQNKFRFDARSLPIPEAIDTDWSNRVDIPATFMEKIISILAPVCSKQADRFNLVSVCLEIESHGRVSAKATDGRRVAVLTGPATVYGDGPQHGKDQMLLPAKFLAAIKKAVAQHEGDVSIRFDERTCSVAVGRGRYTGRLVVGRFPGVERARERFRNDRVSVGKFRREDLLRSLDLAKICTSRATDEIAVSIRGLGDRVEFGARTSMAGQSVVSMDARCEEFEVLVDPNFLCPVLAGVDDDEIELIYARGNGVALEARNLEYCVMSIERM